MADYTLPKSGAAYIFYSGLVDQSDTKKLKSAPTLAAGDFKVSIDGGALANLATLPTNTPGGVMVKFSLSGAEMTGDNITVVCIDAAGAEWSDQLINIQTSPRGVADLAYPATSGRSMVVDASGLVDANAVKVGPSGSGTAQTAGDLAALINTVDDYVDTEVAAILAAVDTEVAAIKAKTDNLPASFPTNFSALGINASGHISRVTLTDTTTTNTDMITAAGIRTAVGLASANLDTQLTAIDDYIDTEVAAILAAVDTEIASIVTAVGTTIPATLAALFTTALTESYRSTNATGSVAQLLYEILANLNEFSISGTLFTAKKLDGSTTAKTYTLNDATNPTSKTETT